jgi:hypothetical protein
MTPAWAGGQHLKGDVHGPPPEVELAEVDVELVVFLGIGERPVVPHVAAEAHVIADEAHRARADVDAEVTVTDLEQRIGILDA